MTSDMSLQLTPQQRCEAYVDDVLSGREIASRKVKAACERYRRDLAKSLDPDYPWRYDETLAERPARFMEKFLKPTKGDYDRMELMPWQCFVECQVYGWVSKKTGLRRYREALVLVGSGNGKSTLVAGNAIYSTCKDSEKGADIYLAANSREQAGIVFSECKSEILNSPALEPHFRVLRDGIYYDANDAKIKSVSSDTKRQDGLNPHLVIFDEIHEYREFKLIDILRRKVIKRRQPLIFYITTMGTVIDGPLAYNYAMFSDALTEGKLPDEVADRMFAFICEPDPEDELSDSRIWKKANPSLGVLLSQSDLETTWARDRLIPQQKADFLTKQLNVMVNADDMAYVQPEVIKRNCGVIDEDALLGRSCYGGFDLSTREDFTAAALEFPLDDGRFFCLLHAWVPRAKVEGNHEKIDYYGLAMRGSLSIVDGEYIQQEDVFEWFRQMNEKYEILTIGYDPANATRLRQMLDAAGFNCEVVRQGPLTLNDPMKDVKEQLLDGNIVTNNDPLFNWFVDNVRISAERRHTDKGNWMPTKRNRFRKIDGFMAFLFAHTVQMQLNPAGGTHEIEFKVYDI